MPTTITPAAAIAGTGVLTNRRRKERCGRVADELSACRHS